MNDYLTLFLGWSIYLFLHSLLAAEAVKSKISISPKVYRLGYSIFSAVGLIWLMIKMAFIQPEYLYAPTNFTKYLGMVISSWGVIIVMIAFRQISVWAFIGLKKEEKSELITTGIHARMRHPIYTGTIMLVIGMLIAVPNFSVLVSVISILIYLPVGIYLEEKKLISVYGQKYLDYKNEVKAILPGLF